MAGDLDLPGRARGRLPHHAAERYRVCDAKFGILFRCDGELSYPVAWVDTPPALAEFQRRRGPFRPEPGTLLARVLQTRQLAHAADYAAEPKPGNAAKLGGARSTLVVPMLKDEELVGAICGKQFFRDLRHTGRDRVSWTDMARLLINAATISRNTSAATVLP